MLLIIFSGKNKEFVIGSYKMTVKYLYDFIYYNIFLFLGNHIKKLLIFIRSYGKFPIPIK